MPPSVLDRGLEFCEEVVRVAQQVDYAKGLQQFKVLGAHSLSPDSPMWLQSSSFPG